MVYSQLENFFDIEFLLLQREDKSLIPLMCGYPLLPGSVLQWRNTTHNRGDLWWYLKTIGKYLQKVIGTVLFGGENAG